MTCHMCDKVFATRSSLVNHMKELHGEIKMFECERCGKGFKRKGHLNRHHRENRKICKTRTTLG